MSSFLIISFMPVTEWQMIVYLTSTWWKIWVGGMYLWNSRNLYEWYLYSKICLPLDYNIHIVNDGIFEYLTLGRSNREILQSRTKLIIIVFARIIDEQPYVARMMIFLKIEDTDREQEGPLDSNYIGSTRALPSICACKDIPWILNMMTMDPSTRMCEKPIIIFTTVTGCCSGPKVCEVSVLLSESQDQRSRWRRDGSRASCENMDWRAPSKICHLYFVVISSMTLRYLRMSMSS